MPALSKNTAGESPPENATGQGARLTGRSTKKLEGRLPFSLDMSRALV
jgi:hypothetical protein